MHININTCEGPRTESGHSRTEPRESELQACEFNHWAILPSGKGTKHTMLKDVRKAGLIQSKSRDAGVKSPEINKQKNMIPNVDSYP